MDPETALERQEAAREEWLAAMQRLGGIDERAGNILFNLAWSADALRGSTDTMEWATKEVLKLASEIDPEADGAADHEAGVWRLCAEFSANLQALADELEKATEGD